MCARVRHAAQYTQRPEAGRGRAAGSPGRRVNEGRRDGDPDGGARGATNDRLRLRGHPLSPVRRAGQLRLSWPLRRTRRKPRRGESTLRTGRSSGAPRERREAQDHGIWHIAELPPSAGAPAPSSGRGATRSRACPQRPWGRGASSNAQWSERDPGPRLWTLPLRPAAALARSGKEMRRPAGDSGTLRRSQVKRLARPMGDGEGRRDGR